MNSKKKSLFSSSAVALKPQERLQVRWHRSSSLQKHQGYLVIFAGIGVKLINIFKQSGLAVYKTEFIVLFANLQTQFPDTLLSERDIRKLTDDIIDFIFSPQISVQFVRYKNARFADAKEVIFSLK